MSTDNLKLSEREIDDTNALKDGRKWRLAWNYILFFAAVHILSLYGIYLAFTKAMWSTLLFACILSVMSNVGVTAGAHRLWSHRSYKVKLPLKILILVMYTMVFLGSVYKWVRYHRVHHKYCDTDADPHNSSRGFFFSHIGWIFLKEHPEFTKKERNIDLTDIENDPLLRMQFKYYNLLSFIIVVVIPTYTPLLWGEDIWTSFIVAVILRYTVTVHMIFSINSAAHMWGYKPYDKDILPAENIAVSLLASGEGFHNYHHTFPWDCRAAELGGYVFNISWLFISMMAKIGWAYDLKIVPEEVIKKRVMRTGDGSHAVWGLEDKDLPAAYKQAEYLDNPQ